MVVAAISFCRAPFPPCANSPSAVPQSHSLDPLAPGPFGTWSSQVSAMTRKPVVTATLRKPESLGTHVAALLLSQLFPATHTPNCRSISRFDCQSWAAAMRPCVHTGSASLLERLKQPAAAVSWARFVNLYTPLLFYWARRWGCRRQMPRTWCRMSSSGSSGSCRISITNPTEALAGCEPSCTTGGARNEPRSCSRGLPQLRVL